MGNDSSLDCLGGARQDSEGGLPPFFLMVDLYQRVAPDGVCSGSEAGSYSRLIDSCITQLKAQGSSRTCNESKEEEKRKKG